MNRWSALQRNTTKETRLRLGFFLLLFIVGTALRFGSPHGEVFPLLLLAGFAAPWLVRDWLVEQGQRALRPIQMVAFVLAVPVVLSEVTEVSVAPNTKVILEGFLGVVLGVVVGVHFWLYSDERIVFDPPR